MADSQASTTPAPAPAPSWSAGLPEPKSSPPGISNDEVAELVKSKVAGKDFIVVDVRRTDFEAYAIPNAINLPAHSFYQTRAGAVSVLSHIPLVVFHCQSCGSSGSRGRKVAAYYQDALDERGLTGSRALYLEGGIKGWIAKYKDDEALILKV